jgi:hypothetical protein
MLSAENEQYREEPGSIKHLIKLPSFFPICSTHCGMTSTEDDDEVGHFILRFSSSPTSSSPPAAATTTTKTILID